MDPLIERLQIEFADRQSKNSKYSLRAFARDLGLNLTSVSMMLKKQRKPKAETRRSLVKSLALPPTYEQEAAYWTPDEEFLEHDKFKMTSEWVHWAILNLVRKGAPPKTVETLQKHLDLPHSLVNSALERLLRLGFVQKKGKHYIRTLEPVRTKDDIPTTAFRKLHGEILDVAKDALTKVPVENREFSTSFLMIRPAHIARAKELTRKFRAEMSDIFDPSNCTTKDAKLHVIAVQLFPLEK